MTSERRRGPRYPFVADAEVIEVSSDTKLIAKTSDLSIGGCFLYALSPFPEGTDVRIRINAKSSTFTTLGKVVCVLRNMGMGVAFSGVADDQTAILQEWISKLSRGGIGTGSRLVSNERNHLPFNPSSTDLGCFRAFLIQDLETVVKEC
jgi:hypothetical protein